MSYLVFLIRSFLVMIYVYLYLFFVVFVYFCTQPFAINRYIPDLSFLIKMRALLITFIFVSFIFVVFY